MSEIKQTCFPVVSVKEMGISQEITVEDTPVILTLVDQNSGKVTCPVFKNGKCKGKFPCYVNDADFFTTVTVAEETK